MVEGVKLSATGASWINQLSFRDLQTLRAVVKKVHLSHYPTEHITDYEADKLIEALGPQTAEGMIAKAVARGLR